VSFTRIEQNLFAIQTFVGNQSKIMTGKRGVIALLALASIILVDGEIGDLQEDVASEEFDVDSASIDYGK
jgi:hypothetical protein